MDEPRQPAFTAEDFASAVVDMLESDGYRLHHGNGHETAADDAPLDKPRTDRRGYSADIDGYWFSWMKDGMPEPEVGATRPTKLQAWVTALRHRLDNSVIPLHACEHDEKRLPA